jgi:tetratricopeptide (TPR) repeat protein
MASDRLLREMVEAIESLAAQRPVILVLEDVHWADYSTIDLISALGRRDTPAKLMVTATYRPAEIRGGADLPLREVVRGLSTAGRCREMTLDYLDEAAVHEFLADRFPGGQFPAALARRLYQRTDGCPLFLVHLVDDLVEQGVLSEESGVWQLAGAQETALPDERMTPAWLAVLETQIPQTVRAMIDAQLQRLEGATREALEAASVAGIEFSAAAVAAAAGIDVVHAERACEELHRRHRFLVQRGCEEWPDGTIATHYRFVHELYHAVVYEQVPIARRARLHRDLGLRIESAWGERAAEEAANLAMHFETGRDWPRAVRYFRHAAQAAGRQYAHREAVHYLRRALAGVERLSPAEREICELDVLNALGVNLQVTRGFAAPEIEGIHARAHALCIARGAGGEKTGRAFSALWGIWLFHKVRSNLVKASEMCGQLLEMAQENPSFMLQAYQAICVTNLCMGKPQVTSEHMERAASIYDPVAHAQNAMAFGQDPGVATMAFGAVALWQLGRVDEALLASGKALALADRLRQPSSRALAMHFAAMLHQCRGDFEQSVRFSRAAMNLAQEEGFLFWHAGGLVLNGWARAAAAGQAASLGDAQAAIEDIRRGLNAWLATGSRTYHTYYLGLLADSLQRVGRARESQRPLDEALAGTRVLCEGLYEAELHRLKGHGIVLTSHDPAPVAANESFQEAAAVARTQGARSFEDRAASDLAALLERGGRTWPIAPVGSA